MLHEQLLNNLQLATVNLLDTFSSDFGIEFIMTTWELKDNFCEKLKFEKCSKRVE